MYFLIDDNDNVMCTVKYSNKKENKMLKLDDCFYKGSTSSNKYNDVISILPKKYLLKNGNQHKLSIKEFKNKYANKINIIESYKFCQK